MVSRTCHPVSLPSSHDALALTPLPFPHTPLPRASSTNDALMPTMDSNSPAIHPSRTLVARLFYHCARICRADHHTVAGPAFMLQGAAISLLLVSVS